MLWINVPRLGYEVSKFPTLSHDDRLENRVAESGAAPSPTAPVRHNGALVIAALAQRGRLVTAGCHGGSLMTVDFY
jgi:hypothetical protein